MNPRSKAIIKTLCLCLTASTVGAIAKISYGATTNTLAFIADGIHSIFDSSATLLGIYSVLWSSKPPDEDHPYGHQKLETVAAVALAMLLFFAAYEVAALAYERLTVPNPATRYSNVGLLILAVTMGINLFIAWYEGKKAKELKSPFLHSDSAHNQSDFLITCSVMVSLLAIRFDMKAVDAGISILIAGYLVYLSIRLIRINIKPLVDSSVLNREEVEKVVNSVKGVLYCHAIRSRGDSEMQFLDLNIHLPGEITLYEAHEITHQVEEKLKATFPGLVDVVIHTEPHDHPPCASPH